jgi:hypothetical protein
MEISIVHTTTPTLSFAARRGKPGNLRPSNVILAQDFNILLVTTLVA